MRPADHAARSADRGVTLARAARRGDTLALHDLLDHLTPYIARTCRSIALDDGPDATQEALIAVFEDFFKKGAPFTHVFRPADADMSPPYTFIERSADATKEDT